MSQLELPLQIGSLHHYNAMEENISGGGGGDTHKIAMGLFTVSSLQPSFFNLILYYSIYIITECRNLLINSTYHTM